MLSKYIVPALAVAGGAYAQCSTSATATIQSAADATAIAGCTTYTGSIAVSASTGGDISFGGLTAITGDLVCNDAVNLTSITANSLQSINGALTMTGLTAINALNFNDLTRVNSLTLSNLGQTLQSLTFSAGLNSISSLTVSDTFIATLSGVSPTTASAIVISNNRYMNTISFPLKSVSGEVQITGYGSGTGDVVLSSLTTAGSLYITNVLNVSLPALDNVTMTASFTENHFTLLSLPNLTTSNSLTIDNNNLMTNFTVPAYTSSSGGLSAQNNSVLTGTISYPALTRVNGAVTIIGAFSDLYMPALTSVLGGMTIISSQVIASTCSHFEALQGASNVIQGKEVCSPTASGTSTSGTTTAASGTGTAASSTSTKTGAASLSYGASEVSAYTVFGIMAAFFGLLM